MKKVENQEMFRIPETPFIQSVKYLVVGGVKYSKQELVEYMKYNQLHR